MLSTLFTNDVRQTLDQFRRSVDQVFDNFYGQTPSATVNATGERAWTFTPVVESGWNDQFLNLRAILPGVAEKDLTVSVQNNQLVIEGERKAPEGFDKNAFTQLAYGKFYTALGRWNSKPTSCLWRPDLPGRLSRTYAGSVPPVPRCRRASVCP